MSTRQNGSVVDRALSFAKKTAYSVAGDVKKTATKEVNKAIKTQLAPMAQVAGQNIINKVFSIGVEKGLEKIPAPEQIAAIVNALSYKALELMRTEVLPKVLYTASSAPKLGGTQDTDIEEIAELYEKIMSKLPTDISVPGISAGGVNIPALNFNMAAAMRAALPMNKFTQLYSVTRDAATESLKTNFVNPATKIATNAAVTATFGGFVAGSLFTFVLYKIVAGGSTSK